MRHPIRNQTLKPLRLSCAHLRVLIKDEPQQKEQETMRSKNSEFATVELPRCLGYSGTFLQFFKLTQLRTEDLNSPNHMNLAGAGQVVAMKAHMMHTSTNLA